jgi:hypothetical protein
MATKLGSLLIVELTNIRELQMTGVAPLGPGSGLTQTTPSVLLKESGRFFSLVEPLKNGPRHRGHSLAKTGKDIIKIVTVVQSRILFFTI